MTKKQLTKFEKAIAIANAKKGNQRTPKVFMGNKVIPYFVYQVNVHYFNLKMMSAGLKIKGMTLRELKDYYGLVGRSAKDCLPQMESIRDMFKVD